MGEEDGDGLLWRCAGKGFVDVVSPELHTHGTNGGVGDGVGDASYVDVECADGEVGVSRSWGNERLESV